MPDISAIKARADNVQRQMSNTLVSFLIALCLAAVFGALGYGFALLY